MKKILLFSDIVLLLLAIAIAYLGLQRDHIFNPPVITGIDFLTIGIVLLKLKDKV